MAASLADVPSAVDMSSSTTTPPPPLPWSAALGAEDATMRNALAFLAEKDSESALIYALVHDPEFRLATALTSNAQRIVDVGVVRALLHVFDAYEDQLRRFVALLMLREMVDTLNWNELFRANSATTAIMREYTCDLGLEFLQAAFQDTLADLWDLPHAYEVNPRLLSAHDDLAQNRRDLEALATNLLNRVFDAAPLFPYQVAKIYRVLEADMTRLVDRKSGSASLPRLSDTTIAETEVRRMSVTDFGRMSSASLPRLSAISEDTRASDASSGLSPAKEEFYLHLGGFLFLRFLCPALLLPHKMGLTPNNQPPSKALQRTLVLVAKLFQSLANNVEEGAREEYMMPFNGFFQSHRSRLVQFYDQICQQAQNDQRRESLILRSNLAPRISQLWTVPPVRGARTSSVATSNMSTPSPYGLLGNAPLDSPVEDALGVVQRWITQHLDALVKEVATHGKAKRKQTPSDGSMSPVKKKKAGPKLKSSKTLSPVPTLGAVDDDEDDDEAVDPLLEAPDNIAADDLARVLGQTVHRDIQLMKIYYASLAAAGLQRLLAVNNTPEEWTLHKSRHSVDVYRRDNPANAHGCFGVGSDRFVEMKAHVEIQATPRQVFKYLRSLEKMGEWNDRTTQVRRVEPLDETKVVLYRSHPKLSLWPTWLVKPRDSCDLHTFVDRTGRPDTYAVLLESVPRPDVPKIKGTVRMSFATGGFLVEPGAVTEARGQTTQLTCVVKADFKGALPRVLAESICVRQVLSVRAIKLRLETTLQHGNSTWV